MPEVGAWYASLAGIKSLGSQSARPGSLAGLHEARKEHLSQFFTPLELAGFMWALAEPALRSVDRRVSILDNAVGSGRLLAYAKPEEHAIYGVDIHGESVAALSDAAAAAGFLHDFRSCGMEEINPRGFDIAFINPPFSIQLSHPGLSAYLCTSHGKYGPGTSAPSHAYALHQALDAATVVVAVLPATYAEEVAADPEMHRLQAIFELPAGAFREEGTEVSTRILVFGGHRCLKPQRISIKDLTQPVPALPLELGRAGSPQLRRHGIEDEGPVITLPVTGDNRVRVVHDGRRIGLRFACGLVQAKVMNAVLRDRITRSNEFDIRHPPGTRYTGQGLLDLEVHLAQPEPQASFRSLLRRIEGAGGFPVVDAGLRGHLARRIRQVAREKSALKHTVFVPKGQAGKGDRLVGIARKRHLAAKVFGAPVIMAGQAVEFVRDAEGRYCFSLSGMDFTLSGDELFERFEVTAGAAADGWQVVHEGLLLKAYPGDAGRWRKRAEGLGIDKWLTWDFQLEDAIELTMKGSAIAAWTMGLGKARLASALILLTGVKRGLICVEAQLVPEMVRELEGLPIPSAEWKVIERVSDLGSLARINIISYERLRMPLGDGGKRMKDTYAGRLRRRIGCLIADEGHLLANASSQQSRALWHLSAKRRFILTGTPAPNYPRDIHPLIVFVGGDGTASQPYGLRRGYLEQNWINSMAYAMRGIDKFRDDFVVMEWCTNEFTEDNRSGAKREIPKLANLDRYRAMLAPWVKRRLTQEPEVARYVRTPVPSYRETVIPWDHAHLAHYLAVCDEFTEWYRRARGDKSSKQLNLVALLARIQAVQFAANFPQHAGKDSKPYMPVTSKQRYAVARLADLTAQGHKTILYADSPAVLDLLANLLRKEHGIDPVVFHGGIPIKKRTREMDRRFRFGDCPVMLATLGVTQAGLNIWQADRAVFYNRSWSAKTEAQALARLLRPQQYRDVEAEFLMLPGGIDTYQAQMVAAKADTLQAGLDWGVPELDDVEFLHLDTLIGRFTERYAEGLGVERHELRKYLESSQCLIAA